MGFSEAVQWWDEWQLRLLVLASLLLQYFLFVAALLRKRRIPPWLRSVTWLAYQGGDAVAIYALAILFNRHEEEELLTHPGSAHLDTLWAPILLLHLGGQDGITAYSIEDNELWGRHFLIAVSQITVAIYVFRKSWWSGDDILLRAAILLFVPGILKCLEKPWALKHASISSIAESSGSSLEKTLRDDGTVCKNVDSLDQFVQAAAAYVRGESHSQTLPGQSGHRVKHEPYHFFVDLNYPYSIRLSNLMYMSKSKRRDDGRAHDRVHAALSKAFDRLYTKHKASFGGLLRAAVVFLTFVGIGLFQKSHRGAYDGADVTVTYILLCCTAVLEFISACFVLGSGLPLPDDQVAQYNLIGYLARNDKHRWLMELARRLRCRDYLDRLWCTAPCEPSRGITQRVHDHVAGGWKDKNYYVHDADTQPQIARTITYRWFNDCRGQWTVKKELSGDNNKTLNLKQSLRRPFDESVLLWHLATDFCYFDHVDTGSEATRRSRVMSNYMAYLLFVKPEMLMPGTRRRLFKAASYELKKLLFNPPQDGKEQAEKKTTGEKKTEKKAPLGSKEELARKIIQKVKSTKDSTKGSGGLVREAWVLAQELMSIDDAKKEKTWRVIEGVWVEMLCFSAARCRGYLHAKSLGKGGEYLSYVWLLLSYMGMETLAERMQRTELPAEGDTGAAVMTEDPTSTTAVESTGDCV
ncbi:uncharacterized protein LOC133900725 [Phragmites australis]|uniref:uncharacterized protein LOC133900725 n=1 Tax=Phragmites australis TaxID=29695 RepID=UPI002D76BCDF|nr:uncharacterized protein LOC133900725 [Phragmites australis]